MHILKIFVYSKLANVDTRSVLTGIAMGLAMAAGAFVANRLVRNLDKQKFQTVVAALLCLVGANMLIFGS